MTEFNPNTQASDLRAQGSDWNDVFMESGGAERVGVADDLASAYEKFYDNSRRYKLLDQSVQDSAGMVQAATDMQIDGLAEGLQNQYDTDKDSAFANFRSVFAQHRDENLRKAAQSILLSNDSPFDKRQKLSALAARYQSPVNNEIEGYAHSAAATNQSIPDAEKAAQAESVAAQNANDPEVMVKSFLREINNQDFGPSVLKNFVPYYSSEYRIKNVLEKLGVSVEDKISGSSVEPLREFSSMYQEASLPERRELTKRALEVIRQEYGTDKLGAMNAVDALFTASFSYGKGIHAVDEAERSRGINHGMWQTIDLFAGLTDAKAIASGVWTAGKIAKEAVQTTAEVAAAKNITFGQAASELAGAYRATKDAAKAAAKDAKVDRNAEVIGGYDTASAEYTNAQKAYREELLADSGDVLSDEERASLVAEKSQLEKRVREVPDSDAGRGANAQERELYQEKLDRIDDLLENDKKASWVAKELDALDAGKISDEFGYRLEQAGAPRTKTSVMQSAASTAAKIFVSPNSLRPGTAANIDAILNPERLKQVMLQSMDEGVEIGKFSKYGIDDVVAMDTGLLPRHPDELVKSIPSIQRNLNVAPVYNEVITSISRGVARAFQSPDHIYFRPGELENAVARGEAEIVDKFRAAKFGDVDLNKTSQVAINDGYLTQYVITGKGSGFTPEKALEAATIYNTHGDDTLRLLYKAPDSDTFVPVKANVKFAEDGTASLPKNMPKGEYAVGLIRRNVYNPDDAVGTNMTLDGHLGRFAAQVDKSTQFDKNIVDTSTYATKQRGLIEASLHEAMKPFSNLGGKNAWKKRKSQARVMEALLKGSGVDGPGQLYKSDELVAMGLSADEITAYYGVRARFDAEYFLNNMARRNELTEEGFVRELEVKGVKHFLKEVDNTSLKKLKNVALPDGRVVPVTDDLVDNTEFVVYKMSNFLEDGGRASSHLLVRASDDIPEGVYFGKMRDEVLPYHNGYIPRIYDANYIVSKTIKVVDEEGVERTYEKAVASARHEAHAREFAAGEGLDPNEAVRFAREVMPTGKGSFDRAGRKRQYNGVVFGRRGTVLEDAEIGHLENLPQIDATRNLKSLGEVLNTSAGITSYRPTMEKVVSRLIDRWNAEYKQYGWSLNTLKSSKADVKPALAAKYKEAVAVREHIAMLQGMDETIMNDLTNSVRMWLGNMAAHGAIRKALPKRVADYVEDVSRRNMNRAWDSRIKSMSFTAFLGLNPTAQLVLQSMQMSTYAGLKGGMSYTLKGQHIRDFMGLMAGHKLRGGDGLSDDFLNTTARAMGMSRKEYDAFLDSFEASGIMQGIDRHQFLESIATSDMVAGVHNAGAWGSTKATLWYGSQLVNNMRKMGFDAGETVNQTMAWLYARQRMIADNPELAKTINHDPNVWKQLSVMATNISGNMDTSARLKHQDGLLGIVLQFTSYATKMSQMMIPRYLPIGNNVVNDAYFKVLGRFGSDIYTNREKLRISMVQLGMFGTMGTTFGPISGGTPLGLVGAANESIQGKDVAMDSEYKPGQIGYWLADTLMEDYGIDKTKVPPEARNIIAQGFAGTMLNHMMSEMYGERVSVDWAGRFAPIGNLQSVGGRAFEIASAITQGNYTAVETNLSGPNFAQARKISSLASHGGNAVLRTAIATVTGYDQPQTAGDLAIFYDKLGALLPLYNNYRQSEFAEATGYFRSQDGQATVAASKGERHLRVLLGLRPVEELPLLSEKNKMVGFYGEQGYGDAEGVQKIANETKRILKDLTVAYNERKLTFNEFEDAVAWHTTMRVHALNEIERAKVEEILATWYMQDALETKEKSFVNAFGKAIDSYGMSYDKAAFKLKSMPDFEGRQKLIDILEVEAEVNMGNFHDVD